MGRFEDLGGREDLAEFPDLHASIAHMQRMRRLLLHLGEAQGTPPLAEIHGHLLPLRSRTFLACGAAILPEKSASQQSGLMRCC